MWPRICASLLLLCLLPLIVSADAENISTIPWGRQQSLLPRQASLFEDRPADCPPCFNCNLDDFKCQQFGECGKSNGRCACPEGFGGEDCGIPLCDSPADGADRSPRPSDQKKCQCTDGWEGINCNVCASDQACDALMPEKKDGVCYRTGLVQKQNHQFCDVTNKKIVDMLDPRRPQATFSCKAENHTCSFQFWVEHQESFYCSLDSCSWNIQTEIDRNTTTYKCDRIQCRCVPGRTLCGEEGLNLTEFFSEKITGPATFTSIVDKDESKSKTTFEESNLNGLISGAFGEESISLSCRAGECLYKTEVPGYDKPLKTINTPLVAGLISGAALLFVALGLIFAWLSRKKRTMDRYNLVRLDDENEAKTTLLADHNPIELHFESVSYSIMGKQILSGIQGSAHPGELVAIMGASGAGKSTLLDILARKNKRGSVRGSFYANGQMISNEDFRSVLGFVDQEDTLLPTLTVHETILDSAFLRLPKQMSPAAKMQKVEEVERQLGIYHIRDSIIGSAGSRRGISGGEKRRVGIACELVTSPSVLLLDEPTSGLDAFNAHNVVECLVNLAKVYNRTVVFTIHQPRSNIVALFDRLILLAEGQTVYSGPFSECQTYFNSIGHSCPTGYNIADYLVDLTVDSRNERSSTDKAITIDKESGSEVNEALLAGTDQEDSISQRHQGPRRKVKTKSSEASADHSWVELSKQTGSRNLKDVDIADSPPSGPEVTGETDLDSIINCFQSSPIAAQIQREIRDAIANAGGVESSISARRGTVRSGGLKGYDKISLFNQFAILSNRTWKNLYRNPMLMLTHYAISILLAVLLGYLFFGLTDDIPGFQNRMGILCFVLALFGFSSLTTLTIFADERLLFMRERANGYYHPFAYFSAKVLFDIMPLRVIPPIIFSIIVYPMTGLVPSWSHFLVFLTILVLFNFAAASVCLFIGIVIRNAGTANLLGSLFMLFSLLFSGLFLNHETIPVGAVWLQLLSIFHYAFEGLLVNEVRYLSLTEHKWGLNIEVPGASILSSFGLRVQALRADIASLAAFIAVFILLGYAAMHVLLIEKR